MRSRNLKLKANYSVQIIISLLLGFVVIVGSYLFFTSSNQNSTNKIILKVGIENIYSSDYSYELNQLPNNISDNNNLIIGKLIKDSKIIQTAARENRIQLDNTFFNTPNKDYGKRVESINSIKSQISSEGDIIKGAVISIWFYNNEQIGSLGYVGGKDFAYKKITELHDKVTSGKLTVSQAGQAIIADTSIGQIDKVFQSNAIYWFNSKKNDKKPISLNAEMDEEIWNLQPGQTSKVYLTKIYDSKSDSKIDSLYYFSHVTDRENKGTNLSFEEWYEANKENYETSVF